VCADLVRRGRPVVPGVVAGLAAVVAAGLLFARSWSIDVPYSIDFQVYWLAGARAAAGHADALYDPGGGPADGTPREMPAYEFKNLPIVSLAFAPFAALDYLPAKRVFWWVAFACLLASGALLGRFVLPADLGATWTRIGWATALLCAMAPAHISLRHGQTTAVVLLPVTAYLAARLRGRDLAAGACLALASAVKIPVLALGAVESLRGRSRVVAAWIAGLAAIVGLSLGIFGPELHRQYLAGLRQHAGSVMTGHNNQSIVAIATRLPGGAPVNDWEPRAIPAVALAATVVSTAVLAVVLVMSLARGGGAANPGLAFPAALSLGIVALPVAWDHYFLLLGPALVSLAVGLRALGLLRRPLVAGSLAAAAAALALPTPRWAIDGASAWGLPGGLLLSHYGLGALAVFVLGDGLSVVLG
jgi:hypothetical protein